jgi:HK97 family phage major capsid protein
MDLEKQLSALQMELKTYFDKAAEEKKNSGSVVEETKNQVLALQKQVDALDSRLAERHAQMAPAPSVYDVVKENESVQRLLKDRRGSAVIRFEGKNFGEFAMQRKTVITEGVSGSIGTQTGAAVGFATSGVLPIDRISGIVPEARQVLRVRNVLAARPTTMAVVDFVKVSTPLAIASPVPEGSVKPENAVSFTTVSEKVRTIATWIPATRQVLDDFTELYGYLRDALPYAVNHDEEIELLSGDGTGEHLHGLIPQSTSFTTGLLTPSAGYNRMDIVGRAVQQMTASNEVPPTFIIMNPNDWWSIRLTKDGFGRYILGDPQMNVTPSIFGLDVVTTTSMAAGTFLVGSGSSVAAEIRDRWEMQVEISTEHADYFIRNMVAIRAEKRLCLVVKRPGAFITGTLASSPLS